jgi:hypothetical protein
MINASKEFMEKLKEGVNVVNYADITLSDGTVLHLEPKDFMIGGCAIEDKATDGKFGVGFVIGKTLTAKIANHDEQFSQYDFYKSIVHLYVALLLDDGSIEKIRKGVYYVTVPSTAGDIIEISAVDKMFELDRDYTSSTTHFPATLQTILTDVCLDCGIPIGFRQFDNMSFVVREKPENVTYRQVVSYAAQIAGYNVRIDNDGYMQLIWYKTSLLDHYNYNGGNFKRYQHETTVYGGDFKDYSAGFLLSGGNFADELPEHVFRIKNLNVHTDDVQITGVRVVGEDDVTAIFGEEGYVVELKGNPFVNGKEKEVSDYLGNRIVGISFRPFSADILNNPLYEPFEVVRVSDRKGNVYNSIVNSVSYQVGAYTKISCEAEDPVRNGSIYSSPAAAAVVEARRNSEKQITEYDKAVQNMNQLAMNALGFYETVEEHEDGSRIVYMHDKPTLEESITIYKRSVDGFFVSEDGGESYTSGFDKNGNAVVNVIYAIGVVADWIRSGRFEAKRGNNTTFLADVDTGEVRIVADSFSLTSGETINSIAKAEAEKAVDGQTQEDVFNKLTNNGENNGIYLEGNNLYINARYINTGEMSANRIRGGILTLGGENNINGVLNIRDVDNEEIGRWDKDGVYINGGSIRCEADDTSAMTIKEGKIRTTYGTPGSGYKDIGYIGANHFTGYDSYKGLTFNLELHGSYMAWAARVAHSSGASSDYIARLLYASETFSRYKEGYLYIGCNVDFNNFEIQDAYINGLNVRNSFSIPNNVDCDIYSNVNFNNYAVQNVKISNLVGVNGYAPYDGTINFVAKIENNSNGGLTWYPATATVRDGIITSVSSNAQ